jgi:hypothetical protein
MKKIIPVLLIASTAFFISCIQREYYSERMGKKEAPPAGISLYDSKEYGIDFNPVYLYDLESYLADYADGRYISSVSIKNKQQYGTIEIINVSVAYADTGNNVKKAALQYAVPDVLEPRIWKKYGLFRELEKTDLVLRDAHLYFVESRLMRSHDELKKLQQSPRGYTAMMKMNAVNNSIAEDERILSSSDWMSRQEHEIRFDYIYAESIADSEILNAVITIELGINGRRVVHNFTYRLARVRYFDSIFRIIC